MDESDANVGTGSPAPGVHGKPLWRDTSKEAEAVLIRIERRRTVEQKVLHVFALIDLARELALAGIRRRYPDASAQELRCRLAALLLDAETVRRVYGWDPEIEGY